MDIFDHVTPLARASHSIVSQNQWGHFISVSLTTVTRTWRQRLHFDCLVSGTALKSTLNTVFKREFSLRYTVVS